MKSNAKTIATSIRSISEDMVCDQAVVASNGARRVEVGPVRMQRTHLTRG